MTWTLKTPSFRLFKRRKPPQPTLFKASSNPASRVLSIAPRPTQHEPEDPFNYLQRKMSANIRSEKRTHPSLPARISSKRRPSSRISRKLRRRKREREFECWSPRSIATDCTIETIGKKVKFAEVVGVQEENGAEVTMFEDDFVNFACNAEVRKSGWGGLRRFVVGLGSRF